MLDVIRGSGIGNDDDDPRPPHSGAKASRRRPSPRRALPLWMPPPWHPPPAKELPKGAGSLGAGVRMRRRGEDAVGGRPAPNPSGHSACGLRPGVSRLPPRGAPCKWLASPSSALRSVIRLAERRQGSRRRAPARPAPPPSEGSLGEKRLKRKLFP